MESVGGSLRATSDLRSPTVLVAAVLVAAPKSPDMVLGNYTTKSLLVQVKVSKRAEEGG